MMHTFKYFLEAITPQTGSHTTQVATTTNSYKKAAEKIKDLLPESDNKILDYGAGLGLGTAAIEGVFGDSATVDSYEPNPGRAKRTPTFTDSDDIDQKYDGIICLNVLNVLEPELREEVTKHILSLLADGGVALIGVRKWSGDVNTAKNFDPAEEEKAIWIKRSGGERVYQKGFDGNELVEWVSRFADGMVVTKISGITANAVLINN